MKLIIDTNFLLIPHLFNVDIFSEFERVMEKKYQLCVLDKTIGEMERIIETQKGKHKAAAKLGLALVKAKNVKVIKTGSDKHVDDLLVLIALKEKITVATQDKMLKVRLNSAKASVLTLRQKKFVVKVT